MMFDGLHGENMKRFLRMASLLGLMIVVFQNTVYARELTVSVIIPCVPKHAPYLFNLLSHYARQTEVPQEVIISISQIDLISKMLIDAITSTDWPFKLIIIRNARKTSAGKNRNLGAEAAQGDILMFQDADDIPHPQRVEIIRYFFGMYDIYHLMHFYVVPKRMVNNGEVPEECMSYQKSRISFRVGARYQESSEHYPFHNGQPCVLRSMASKIMWPDQYTVAEDVAYSRSIYNRFPDKTIIIEVPLVVYRNQLTSGWPSL
jgi:glycosyltransferase involved in cell wall biosynthesis